MSIDKESSLLLLCVSSHGHVFRHWHACDGHARGYCKPGCELQKTLECHRLLELILPHISNM